MIKNYTVSDEIFDNLKWENASICDFVGCTIIGAEPVVDRCADDADMVGMILYMRKPDGQQITVEIKREDGFEELIVSKADIYGT